MSEMSDVMHGQLKEQNKKEKEQQDDDNNDN